MKHKDPHRNSGNQLMYEGLALCICLILLSVAIIIMNMY